MRRSLRLPVAVLAVVVLGVVVVQWALGQWLERRFEHSLVDGAKHSGSIDRISVCLPCLAYTIHGLELEDRETSAPILSAREGEVSVDLARLPRLEWRGRIALHDATLHVDLVRADRGGSGAFSIPWSDLGRGLFPAPIGRIEAADGELVVSHDRYEEPIVWRFGIRSGALTGLSQAQGEPRLGLVGSTPGGGSFDLALAVGEEHRAPSRLQGEFRDVSLPALGDYIRQRLGYDVEGGSLTARIELDGTPGGWAGHIDCEVRDLDIFDLDDFTESGPLQAAKDGFAEILTRSRGSSDDVMRMRIDVAEQTGADDPWLAAGRILRWLILAPFELLPVSEADLLPVPEDP